MSEFIRKTKITRRHEGRELAEHCLEQENWDLDLAIELFEKLNRNPENGIYHEKVRSLLQTEDGARENNTGTFISRETNLS